MVDAGEGCDDGNLVSGDGCDANCRPTGCGNGIVTTGELCDDGNVVNGDGCDANCTASGCGNGVVTAPETCDDGNLTNGDGCDANCTVTGCGNGVTTGAELCDDGNLINGDGCSALCQRELLNPVPAAADHFGTSVAALGPNIVASAPEHDMPGALNTGIVYVYSAATGAVVRILQNPTPAPGDAFGFSVATIGSKVIVGAPLDDTAGPNAGAVYVFEGNTGALVRTFLNPGPGGNDNFGWSVASAANGKVLIGAPLDDNGSGGGGAAYLYDIATGTLLEVYLNPSPASMDAFGFSVAGTATQVIVGTPGHDIPASGFNAAAPEAGAAYVFGATTGTLLHSLFSPTPGTGDRLGAAVAALGNDFLVGAPAADAGPGLVNTGRVFLFAGGTGTLLRSFQKAAPELNDEFGYSVSAVGTDKVVIGARLDNTGVVDGGAAYLFDAGTAALLQEIRKPNANALDNFGAAVAGLGSGEMIIGAPLDDTVAEDAGAVYVFNDTSCGNGVVNANEQCDDANMIDGDGCDSNCTPTACGNGIVTAGEACDDGNLVSGDGCSASCTLEGPCGNGVVTGGELCDDGNLVNGDGCDANCTPTGCGNGVVTTGEACDHGTENGLDLCCTASCTLVDGDGDGVCDRDDVCPSISDPAQLNTDGDVFGNACDICPSDTNNDSDGDGFCIGATFNPPASGGGDPCSRTGSAGHWEKPQVLLTRLLPPFGDEKLRIKGSFKVGNSSPVIAPDMNGVHLRIVDNSGRLVVDEVIPGGTLHAPARNGWRAAGSPARKWIYVDKNPTAIHNGIRKLTVKNLSRFNEGVYGVFVKGKDGNYQIQPGQQPITVTMELNAMALPHGGTPGRDQCGDAVFSDPPAHPNCEFFAAKLVCK